MFPQSGHKPCVRVWEASSGDQLKALQGHSFGISSVSFSPNTKAVVSVGFTHDSTVCVWNWKVLITWLRLRLSVGYVVLNSATVVKGY